MMQGLSGGYFHLCCLHRTGQLLHRVGCVIKCQARDATVVSVVFGLQLDIDGAVFNIQVENHVRAVHIDFTNYDCSR